MSSPRTSGGRTDLRRVLAGMLPLSLLVQACSFASSIVLARLLGAGTTTDAYFLGLSVPTLVYGILLAAVRLGAIPALTELDTDDERGFGRACSELVSTVAAAAAVLSAIATGVTVALLPQLVGGGPSLASSTRLAILELAPFGVLGALTGVLGALLAVRRSFLPAVIVMAFEPLLKIGLMLALGKHAGLQALVGSNLAGSTLAVVVLWVLVVRSGVALRPVRAVGSTFVRTVIVTSAPLLVSQSVLQINPVVDRTMVSDLGRGSVTAMELGLRLFAVPAGLLTGLLITPVTAAWSDRHVNEGWGAVRESLGRAIAGMAAAIPPLVVLGVMLRRELVTAIYHGGAYSAGAIHQTAGVFGMILLSLPAQMLVVFLATLFVVRKDTVFPMKVAFANVVLNVALNFALRPLLGAAGIALSTTLTVTLLAGVYAAAAQRRWQTFTRAPVVSALVRAGASAAAVAGASAVLLALLPEAHTRPQALVAVGVVGATGLSLHALVLFATRERSVATTASRLLRLAGRAT